jgi:Tripartite tricarboxylate transporter TctA family/Tripartite tricarboxylate transporter family receptor
VDRGAARRYNLLWCLAGAVIGTCIGVLPGIGPVATMALLLAVTYLLPPVGALIMLAGIYYGAQHGGSTTAIFVNLPGESSSVVTTLDGYQVARQGRAGRALAIAALMECGYANSDVPIWYSLFAPAGTPKPIVAKFNAKVVEIARTDEMRDRMRAINSVVPVQTPEEMATSRTKLPAMSN